MFIPVGHSSLSAYPSKDLNPPKKQSAIPGVEVKEINEEYVEVHQKSLDNDDTEYVIEVSPELADTMKKLDVIAQRVKQGMDACNQWVDLFATEGRSVIGEHLAIEARKQLGDNKSDAMHTLYWHTKTRGADCDAISKSVFAYIFDNKNLCDCIQFVETASFNNCHTWVQIRVVVNSQEHTICVDPWAIFPPFVFLEELGKFKATIGGGSRYESPKRIEIKEVVPEFETLEPMSDKELNTEMFQLTETLPGTPFIGEAALLPELQPYDKSKKPPLWNQLFSTKKPEVIYQIGKNSENRFKFNIIHKNYYDKVVKAMNEIDEFRQTHPDLAVLPYNREGLEINEFYKKESSTER